MRKTKLLTGVSAFALAAALSSGAWADGVSIFIDSNVSDVIVNAAGVDQDVATGSADGSIGDSNTGDIGQAVSGVWLGQVVVNAVNNLKSGFSGSVTLAASMSFGANTFDNQIANVNNFNTAVNAVQQGAVTITVAIGSNL